MLNIELLTEKFDEILASFTVEKLDQWLLMVQERETEEQWLKGDTVELNVNHHPTNDASEELLGESYSELGIMDSFLNSAA